MRNGPRALCYQDGRTAGHNTGPRALRVSSLRSAGIGTDGSRRLRDRACGPGLRHRRRGDRSFARRDRSRVRRGIGHSRHRGRRVCNNAGQNGSGFLVRRECTRRLKRDHTARPLGELDLRGLCRPACSEGVARKLFDPCIVRVWRRLHNEGSNVGNRRCRAARGACP